MGIYIKGMKMPENCWCCPLVRGYQIWQSGAQKPVADAKYCRLDKNLRLPIDKKPDDCPLVEIPPHGRLIDADAPIEVWEVRLSDGDRCSFRNIETTVSKFLLSHLMGEVPPTIIPADKEEEGE